ncbi:hypothetical protein [Actinoplanes sp. NPDC026623]|uniref:hypothetical protein n=1 Tax=Actinoplanes sp. NPDC026623 TaxID=3155610 RepID=UPI00340AD4C5
MGVAVPLGLVIEAGTMSAAALAGAAKLSPAAIRPSSGWSRRATSPVRWTPPTAGGPSSPPRRDAVGLIERVYGPIEKAGVANWPAVRPPSSS